MELDIVDPPIERAKNLGPGDQAEARSGNQSFDLEIVDKRPDGSFEVLVNETHAEPDERLEDMIGKRITAQWFNFIRVRPQGEAWDDGLSFPDEKADQL
ncbi:hypothetical protein [Modicisalibacter luteus]|uniref:Multi-ubiquitin domain-containing protein n=1 Tax=Modicisalibacter luteus TaxID=453962 RepID=A0ABV7LZK1_9GAMM|nr:hypothetical protein [Halomonas lutea]GHA95854.1 hypothetical protein GCM10007159_16740 [Halomonas lutea]